MNQSNLIHFLLAAGLALSLGESWILHGHMKEMRESMAAIEQRPIPGLEASLKEGIEKNPKLIFRMAQRGGEMLKLESMEALWKAEAKDGETMPMGTGVLTRGRGVPVDVFTSFDCPFCRRAHETLEKAKGYAWSVHMLAYSEPADLAARAFLKLAGRDAAKAWAYYDELMGMKRPVWKDPVKADGRETYPVLRAVALKHGLSEAEFASLAADPELGRRMEEDSELSKRAGLRGTPFYVIKGRIKVQGSVPPRMFQRAAAIADGKTLGPLYKDGSGDPAGGGAEEGRAKPAGAKEPAQEKPAEKPAADAGSLIDGVCRHGETDCR